MSGPWIGGGRLGHAFDSGAASSPTRLGPPPDRREVPALMPAS